MDAKVKIIHFKEVWEKNKDGSVDGVVTVTVL